MSDLLIAGTKVTCRPNNTVSFGAQGGTAPYTFSVSPYVPGVSGAGGTIDPVTGLYTAPNTVRLDTRNYYDQVTVTDNAGSTAKTSILVGHSWMMVGNIFQVDLRLPLDRIYFWNVKEDMPEDNNLFLVLALSRQKPIASNIQPSGTPPSWAETLIWTQVNSTLDIHVYSRGLDAVNRLPEIFASLQGPYSRSTQRANGFYLSKIPHNAVDVSGIDGAALPYHDVISCEMIWTHSKLIEPPVYTKFQDPPIDILVEV